MTSPQASSSPSKPSIPTPTTASSPSARLHSSPSAPSISLTPATPVTALDSTVPEHPQPPAEMSSTPAAPAAAASTAPASTKPVTSEKVAPAAASSSKPTTSSNAVQASTSKPESTSAKPVGQKKKRRRKGFAGLLLSLGCLSASEFEDDPKEVKKREAAAAAKTAGTGNTEAKPAAAAPVVKEKPAEAVKGTEGKTAPGKGAIGAGAAAGVVAGTAGAALGHVSDKREKEEVVAPPAEPVSPPLDETAGVTSSAVQPPGSGSELLQTTPSRPIAIRRESEAGTPSAEQTSSGGYTEMLQTEATDSQDRDEHADAEGEEDYGVEEEYEDEEDRLIAQGGIGIPLDEYGRPAPLLPPIAKEHTGRKCLVLDLDETLLHSSFKMLPSADYIVPVEIESQTHNVYVIKRPGVDKFLTEMGKIYEVVVFTASLSKYADPVLDMLDPDGVVKHRLFRESCYNHKGNYVKDLSQLGRTMETCIILDNSPASYIFHPNNAVPVSTWFNDPHDTELTDLCPFLADLATVDDIRGVLDGTL